jgi:hypothetical protein
MDFYLPPHAEDSVKLGDRVNRRLFRTLSSVISNPRRTLYVIPSQRIAIVFYLLDTSCASLEGVKREI